jgi:hypothetical protein
VVAGPKSGCIPELFSASASNITISISTKVGKIAFGILEIILHCNGL